MPKTTATQEEKHKAHERARREFPGNKALQDIHYIRYVREIEWRDMSMEEIQEEIRKAKRKLGLDESG